MRMRMRMELELFEAEELERLFQQAVQLWREMSFRIQGTDEFFDYLRAFGCRVDGEQVRFPEGVIERTLARIGMEKEKWVGENGGKEEWPASELEMFTHGQALHICDLESNELRAAGPITVAGSLVQNTAESLALNAMSLAIDDRTQGITGTSAMIDMKDLAHRQSGPDLALHMLAGSEMHAHLFGGRPRIGISGVAAPTVSPQSVYEKGMSTAFNIAAGQRQLGIGCLAFSDVGSPVQLVLDYEMGGYFQHLFREVNADDEHVGLETIMETIPRGAFFMESEQTARLFREECWLPAFVDHRVPLAWARDPSDMIERAREKARELRDTAENQCSLPETTRKQIQELIKEADTLVGT